MYIAIATRPHRMCRACEQHELEGGDVFHTERKYNFDCVDVLIFVPSFPYGQRLLKRLTTMNICSFHRLK